MKLLSIAIPCYNSQSYMRKCVESLLPGGDDVEIIIVNDGSKDETATIAEEYAVRYPSIVKTVHQETYILCRQYFCISSVAACKENVLFRCRFLQILHRTCGSVCK